MRFVRVRGDTNSEEFVLKTKRGRIKSTVNLDLVSSAVFAFNKNGNVLKINMIKSDDAISGVMLIPFNDSQVDTIGKFDYDVQIIDTNGKKITFALSTIEFVQDVNTD